MFKIIFLIAAVFANADFKKIGEIPVSSNTEKINIKNTKTVFASLSKKEIEKIGYTGGIIQIIIGGNSYYVTVIKTLFGEYLVTRISSDNSTKTNWLLTQLSEIAEMHFFAKEGEPSIKITIQKTLLN